MKRTPSKGSEPHKVIEPCPDHWHCDPVRATHACGKPDRRSHCPSCFEQPDPRSVHQRVDAGLYGDCWKAFSDDLAREQGFDPTSLAARLSYRFAFEHRSSMREVANAYGECAMIVKEELAR